MTINRDFVSLVGRSSSSRRSCVCVVTISDQLDNHANSHSSHQSTYYDQHKCGGKVSLFWGRSIFHQCCDGAKKSTVTCETFLTENNHVMINKVAFWL
jgi:hypothetical protein